MKATLGNAIALASVLFAHVKDKGGKPYILHCLQVMYDTNSDNEDVKMAAVLHDVIEDTNHTLEDLRTMGYSDDTITLLDLLTHNTNDTYEAYITRLSSNPDAILIKQADLRHNSLIARMSGSSLKTQTKYWRAYAYLDKVKGLKPECMYAIKQTYLDT